VSGQIHVPAALFLVKEPPAPIIYEALRAPEPVWTTLRREHCRPSLDAISGRSAVQRVASRYTECALSIIKIKTQIKPTQSLTSPVIEVRSF
jgi:hypothetical protein